MISPLRCLDLLRLQIAASLDDRGRIADCYGVTLASCDAGHALWIGDAVPDDVAAEIEAALAAEPLPANVTEPPAAMTAWQQILERAGGPLTPSGGPSYVFSSEARLACDAVIECSDRAPADWLRGANPGNWHPVEWDELLDGRLGPWAFALQGERVVSICHTPGPITERSAECGVWTEPQFRGRGYAAATASAWAALVRSPARTLFYSTDADNRSSQRVAQRLGLAPIGWTWRLRRPRGVNGLHVHPLCSLYPRATR